MSWKLPWVGYLTQGRSCTGRNDAESISILNRLELIEHSSDFHSRSIKEKSINYRSEKRQSISSTNSVTFCDLQKREALCHWVSNRMTVNICDVVRLSAPTLLCDDGTLRCRWCPSPEQCSIFQPTNTVFQFSVCLSCDSVTWCYAGA